MLVPAENSLRRGNLGSGGWHRQLYKAFGSPLQAGDGRQRRQKFSRRAVLFETLHINAMSSRQLGWRARHAPLLKFAGCEKLQKLFGIPLRRPDGAGHEW
jgi:hypothetical protein